MDVLRQGSNTAPCLLSCREYRSRFTSDETLMFCMRVMVGVIILYDHVHPVGAFCKTSKIDVRTVTNSAFQIRALTNDARQTSLSLSLSPPSTTWRQESVQEARPPIGSYPHSKMSSLFHVLTAKHAINNPGRSSETLTLTAGRGAEQM